MNPQPGGAGGCGGETGGSARHTCPRVAGILSKETQGVSAASIQCWKLEHKKPSTCPP